MLRALVPPLATTWVVLSALLVFIENDPHLRHRGLGLALPAVVISAGWLLGWLRSEAWKISRDDQGYWLLWGLGLLPILGLSALLILRDPADGLPVSILKTLLFAMPYMGLALSAKTWSSGGSEQQVHRYAPLNPESRTRPVVYGPTASSGRLVVAVGDARRVLDASQILWLEADDNYVRIHTADRDYDVRQSLRNVLIQLGPSRFARIHKSRAVNREEVESISPTAKGDAEVFLRGGQRLRMSRRYRQELPLF